jgi:hypothetical protein
MIQSENINDLMNALVCAQAEFPTMPKNKEGYNYKYTDLDTIVQTIKPIMKKYNLAFLQSVGGLDSVTITTRIFHTSGQYIEDTVLLPSMQSGKMNNAQILGATITYMRRYTLCAMLGITADEDVDCSVQTAPAKASEPKASPAPFEQKGGKATQVENDRLNALCHAKYANGQNVFSVDEINTYLGYRKDKTAAELIQFIENALKNRMPDSELIK